jgi:hypothetical protein
MRREKRREENAKRFFVQQDRLRKKRKNSDPSSVITGQNSASGQSLQTATVTPAAAALRRARARLPVFSAEE